MCLPINLCFLKFRDKFEAYRFELGYRLSNICGWWCFHFTSYTYTYIIIILLLGSILTVYENKAGHHSICLSTKDCLWMFIRLSVDTLLFGPKLNPTKKWVLSVKVLVYLPYNGNTQFQVLELWTLEATFPLDLSFFGFSILV